MIRLGTAAALLACTFGAGTALADDNPFSLSLSGSGGRNARLATTDGKVIYEHICQSCHMADAKGAEFKPSKFPALAGNAKFAAKLYPVMMVLNGQGAMPPFGASMGDEQVAAVVNYIRGNFGNSYSDTVAPAEVKPLRPAVQQAPTELRGR
jgi:mono/diheme cytochrome c family protein